MEKHKTNPLINFFFMMKTEKENETRTIPENRIKFEMQIEQQLMLQTTCVIFFKILCGSPSQ